MTRTLSLRLPPPVTMLLALALIVTPAGSNRALAHGGPKATKTVKGQSKNKARGKTASRSHHSHRTYTLRGNPEVTRQVATELIAEKLPDLASLVGIQPATDVVNVVNGAAAPDAPVAKFVASTGITGGKTLDAYQDSELNDDEDPDKITAEDEQSLQELPTDINSFYKEFTKYMATLNGESTIMDNGVDKIVVMETLMDWVGTRYLFGGMGRNGIDCSAFTGTIYRSMNYKLPRTAAAQWDAGLPVTHEELQFGDLVFFHTRQAVYVSHVGMYLGNNMFAHASSRNGVTVSSLETDYYATHLIGARRYDVNAGAGASSTVTASAPTGGDN